MKRFACAALVPVFALLGACTGSTPGAAARDGGPDLQASIERGRLAITRYPCGSCHRIPDVPAGRRPYSVCRYPSRSA